MRVSMGYPDRDNERQVLLAHREGEPVEQLQPVVDCERLLALQRTVREVSVDEAIYEYLLDLAEATRNSPELHVGVSTRGVICLYRAAQALALLEGRDYVIPDDVKRLSVAVLAHRVIPRGYAQGSQRENVESLIGQLVDAVPVPE